MKARQAKKILKAWKGGKTSKLSHYWYVRMVMYYGHERYDHRIAAALKRTHKTIYSYE